MAEIFELAKRSKSKEAGKTKGGKGGEKEVVVFPGIDFPLLREALAEHREERERERKKDRGDKN